MRMYPVLLVLLVLTQMLLCVDTHAHASSSSRRQQQRAGKPLRVIIDTDIGHDFDDSWALTLALSRPDLFRVELVLTATDDTVGRAQIVARYLQRYGRAKDVAIGIGPKDLHRNSVGALYGWAKNLSLAEYASKDGGIVHDDGVKAAADILLRSANESDPVYFVAIAPPTNFQSLVQRFPAAATHVEHIYAMFGSVYYCYGHQPVPNSCPEYNADQSVAASRAFLGASWPISTTPLDTCGEPFTVMTGQPWALLNERKANPAKYPWVQILLESYCYWAHHGWWKTCEHRSDIMFDAVALWMTHTRDQFLNFHDIKIEMADNGAQPQSAEGRPISAALTWKDGGNAKFFDQVVEWVSHPVRTV